MKFLWHFRRLMKTAGLLAPTLLLSSLAAGQTNLSPARVGPRPIWEYETRLDLTGAQRERWRSLHDRLEIARAELRRASASNTPPDVRLAAQLHYNDRIRITTRAIGDLLTREQKETLTRLRKQSPNVSSTAAETIESAADSGDETAPPPGTTRKPPRASLSPEGYLTLAAELRAVYSQPATNWPRPNIDDEVKPRFRERSLLLPVVYPTSNPYTDVKAELGKKLFFDPRLSGSGQISCASCHDPDLAFADGRAVAFGHQRKELKRNAPTALNTAFNASLFWDGRADSLEQQAADVINNQDEMHASARFVRERLNGVPGYTNTFAAAFGSPDVTLDRAAQAIATFERTLTSRGNRFDSFLRGDTNALSDEAIRGLHLFRTTARCINCHNGPNFTDGRFHNEGLTYYGRKYEDLGRYQVTKDPQDVGRFKTPTLRNIARTAPYMHNGLFDLDGVLNMYNAGMATVRRKPSQKDDPLFPVKSPLLQPLGLNQHDLADLKAFLESLSETRLRMRPPELPADGVAVTTDGH